MLGIKVKRKKRMQKNRDNDSSVIMNTRSKQISAILFSIYKFLLFSSTSIFLVLFSCILFSSSTFRRIPFPCSLVTLVKSLIFVFFFITIWHDMFLTCPHAKIQAKHKYYQIVSNLSIVYILFLRCRNLILEYWNIQQLMHWQWWFLWFSWGGESQNE